ncbi:MAG: hypothetical protein GY862_25420 [Gammaproteobacteria bacterium]|nr:hypothetical protein [Gammaproteobacteria bacterium]
MVVLMPVPRSVQMPAASVPEFTTDIVQHLQFSEQASVYVFGVYEGNLTEAEKTAGNGIPIFSDTPPE